MTITEQQFMVLHQTAVESLRIADRSGLFTYDRSTRQRIVDDIINQQNGPVQVIDPKSEGRG